MKVRVWSLDVWGNEREGFEVNDRSVCLAAEVPDNFFQLKDRDVVRWLKDQDLVKPRLRVKSLAIEGDGETFFYIDDARNGRPEYQIERKA